MILDTALLSMNVSNIDEAKISALYIVLTIKPNDCKPPLIKQKAASY